MSDEYPVSWKQMDEFCRKVVNNVVTVELIGRRGNVSRAAAELGFSPNGLNSRLAPMVEYLGGPVVESKGRELTPLGLRMRQLFEGLKPTLTRFIADVDQLKNKSDFRLAIVKSIWEVEQDWLLAEYRGRMPDATITAKIEDGPLTIEDRVRKGDADIGLTSYPQPEKYIAAPVKLHFWRNDRMMLIVPYEDAYTMTTTLSTMPIDRFKAMPNRTFYILPEGTAMARSVSEYLRQHKVHFTYKVPLSSIDEILKRVVNGEGVSILPEPAVEKSAYNLDVEMFRLVPELVRPVGILYRENSLKRELIDQFIECVLSHKNEPKKTTYDAKKSYSPGPGQKPGNV